MKLQPPFRKATADDAMAIAELADMAADGICRFLWSQSAGRDRDALSFGAGQCRQADTWCSYQNAVLVEIGDKVAALGLMYPLESAAPAAQEPAASEPLSAPFRELERRAIGTFYLDSLAVYPAYRRQGWAGQLMALSEQKAAQLGYDRVSLQVFEENRPALEFYRRRGFAETARQPCHPHPCHPWTGDVLLMIKPVA